MILEKFPDYWDHENNGEPKWLGVMIGKNIELKLMKKIREGLFIDDDIPVAGLTINRYRGEDGNVYVITDTYFVEKVKNKDYTKYSFRNNLYPKNRLVLAVMKEYVSENPDISFSKLEKTFPQSLQGNKTFAKFEEAQEIYKRTDYKRFFLEPDEIIQLSDCRVAVSTQWGIGNIGRFLEKCKELNYKIEANKE